MKLLYSFSILAFSLYTFQMHELMAEEDSDNERITLSQISKSGYRNSQNVLSQTMFDGQSSANLLVVEKPANDSCSRFIINQTAKRRLTIPQELLETHQALKIISSQIEESDFPDIIDIIFLMDANGKTQSLIITKFLAKLEDTIENKFKATYPDADILLSFPVDAFVGAGSGAIPAAIAALSKNRISKYIPTLESIHSKVSRPKRTFCGCCVFVSPIVKDFVSAYHGDLPIIEDEDGDDFDKLIVDNFDFRKKGCPGLVDIFGGYSRSDLNSNLEVISLSKGSDDNVLDMVVSAINARYSDTQKKLKYIDIADVLENAEFALEKSTHLPATSQKKIDEAINALKKLNFVSMQSDKKYGSINELKSILTSNTKIRRNLIIVSLTAQTAAEISGINRPISTIFSSKVKYAENDLKIVNFNYKFLIPSYIYDKDYRNALDASVNSLFPEEDEVTQMSLAQNATNMLVDFLKVCNAKALSAIEKDSENRDLLLPQYSQMPSYLTLVDSCVQTDSADIEDPEETEESETYSYTDRT